MPFGCACVSPATALVGWTSVELLSDGVALRSGGSFLYYSRVWVSAVVPLLGPVEGGTRLTVLGAPFREAATLRCRFDERSKTVTARHVGAGQLECATPAQPGEGARAVEVSLNAQQFSTSGVAFTYVPTVALSSVWPSRGASEGGTAVTVHGSGLTALSEQLGYLQCRFNGTVVQASAASGASAVCNSSSATGIVSVEVSSNGRDFTTSGVQFELVRVVLSEVAPWTGPDLGGTLVTLTGSGIGAVSPLSLDCRFGELEPVSASVHLSLIHI